MRYQRQNSPKIAKWHSIRCRRGFTLLEIALVLLVLTLGTILGLSLAGRSQQRRNCDRFIQDLRIFDAAFAGYHQQHNSWPAASNAGIDLPPDLAEALKDTSWFQGSPFGGSYGWVAPEPAGASANGAGHEWDGCGAVTLTAFSPSFPLTLDKADLLNIDSQIDDGNLATGRFRTGFNGWPVFLVEAVKR